MTNGKLKATDRIKPILMTSLPNEGERFSKILPTIKIFN